MTAAAENWYDSDVATFGDRLAAAREAAGMEQAALARRLGVKASTIRKWEEDLSEPRANRLSMIAGLLGVSITWLIDGTGEGVDSPEATSTDADAEAMLAELRTLRTTLISKAEHVGRLEKRLKKFVVDQSLG